MNVTTWQKPSRVFSRQSIREFYDGDLAETHAFLFRTARLELPAHGGGFSLKLALSGAEDYLIGRRTVRVAPGDLLCINAGETYGSRIRQPTQSLSLFFTREHIASALASLHSRRSVTEPDDAPPREVPQIRVTASRENWRRACELARRLLGRQADRTDAAADDLLLGVLCQLFDAAPPTALCDLRRRATRDELLGRLLRAREYIEDMQGERCSLDELASVACLSRFHFLRLFREVFGLGPAACARERRLRVAARSLERGQSEDTAAVEAGYANRHSLRRALKSTRLSMAAN